MEWKMKKETKQARALNKQITVTNMVNINATILIIILNMNSLNTPIKKHKFSRVDILKRPNYIFL